MARRVFITGVTGQDGAYLARLLLEEGCAVYGGCRRSSSSGVWRLEELGVAQDVTVVPFEMLEASNVQRTLAEIAPDEIYNFAAQSFVGVSFMQPEYTCDVTAMGTLRVLEAIRALGAPVAFYQASSSEMFGNATTTPQDETTPFAPISPYAIAKAFAHWQTVAYRRAYSMHACCGIAFNHESPLRGSEFVTQKVVRGLVRIRAGRQGYLELGNLDARRDWGFAGDYVHGMWRTLQHATPDDYVLATGESHSVREFVEAAAAHLDMRIEWEGSGGDEIGLDGRSGRPVVRVDPSLLRPSDVDHLVGDASKARVVLGWVPETGFEELVGMMVDAELRRRAIVRDGGA